MANRNLINFENLLKEMKQKNFTIFSDDSKNFNLNFVGIRNKSNKINTFNDAFIVFWKHDGIFNMYQFIGTTDPGLYYTKFPLNSRGVMIMKEQQVKGYFTIGKHKGLYKALVQSKPCLLYRDNNKDSKLDKNENSIEKAIVGANFHRASNSDESIKIGKYSAGCQVAKNASDYNLIMQLFTYSSEIWGNSFTYTLIEDNNEKSKIINTKYI